MRNNITFDFSPAQVESLAEKLPIENKIRLIHRLERETWASKLDNLTQRIRRRIKSQGITDKEINRICEVVRKERYARNQSRH